MASTATAGDADPGASRAVLTVAFVVFLDLVGFGVVIPILPYYVRSFGTSDLFIGLLAASYSVMQFAFAPLLGRLSDSRGRRPVLLLSLAGSAVAWTIFGIGGSLAVLFVSRMLAGAMGGNVATAQAYVADVTPEDRRAGALGLLGAAFGLGFVVGPAVGGAFASEPVVAAAREVLPAAVPATRFSLPSFAAAVSSLVALGVGAVFLAEPERTLSIGERPSFLGQFVVAARDARLGPLVAAFLVHSVAFSGVQVMFIPFAADQYGYGASTVALLLTYIGVVGALNQGVLVGRLARRYPDRHLATAGGSLLLVALAALPFAPQLGAPLEPLPGPAFLTGPLVALLAVLTLLSLGNGLLTVALSTLVSRAAGAGSQGAAFGVSQGAGSLGRTLGPPAMAALYVAAYWSPFAAGAALMAGVLGLVALVARADRAVATTVND